MILRSARGQRCARSPVSLAFGQRPCAIAQPLLSGQADAALRRAADEPRPGAGDVHARADLRDRALPANPRKERLAAQSLEPERTARQAVRRGIVDSISHGSVGRFLKRGRPQTASRARLLTPKPDPEFESKCAEVCTLYHEAPARRSRTFARCRSTKYRRAGVGARRPGLAGPAGKVARGNSNTSATARRR